MARADILAVVEDQFYDIRKRLDIQLGRTAELQAQIDAQGEEMAALIDAQRKDTAALREQVKLVHALLKTLTAQDS